MTGLSDDAVRRLQAVAAWPDFTGTRYTALEEIGSGGMGTVYLARDEPLDREVAVKVSRGLPLPGGDAALERRVQVEARILARLEHPGIVPVHDVGRLADGRVYYVMKRVRGRTLLELLREDEPAADVSARRDREAERLRIFERICDPVAFAHAHGCIHRDLKPENVMVGEFGEVMVMDWGVAKIRSPEWPSACGPRDSPELGRASEASRAPAAGGGAPALRNADGRPLPAGNVQPVVRTHDGTVLGTPGFMPPEQAEGAVADVDQRADVYGLGAILFMLLADEPPPASAERAVTLMQGAGPPFDRIPAALRAICAKALAPTPSERYVTVRALSAEVARYRAGQAVDAHHESFVERTERFVRTYRTPILLVLAYIIMRALVAIAAR